MLIQSIKLNNFRLYKDSNEISFSFDKNKNIYLIAGENGFGKTTFLLSLVWCLYGKQMPDVEESIKKDLSNNGGYNAFLLSNLNNDQRKELEQRLTADITKSIKSQGYTLKTMYLQKFSQYSVSINFTDILIPSIPCNSVQIIRTFDFIKNEESVEILIDGIKNELCAEIGVDVFINDFILNKDIARFFFFDSEKIVALAEINTISEKRKLSSAYNEVLGVKKYEDLKKNLENLRIRLRKKSGDIEGRNKLSAMFDQQSELQSLLSDYETMIKSLEYEIKTLKKEDDEFQLQLFREGNSMTLENLKSQQYLLETLQKKDADFKAKLKELLDYAPFAIAGKAFINAKYQVDKDIIRLESFSNIKLHNELLNSLSEAISKKIKFIKLNAIDENAVNTTIQKTFEAYYKPENEFEESTSLLTTTKEQHTELQAIFSNITSTFKMEFERLTDDYRKNHQILDRTARKISNAKANESDSLIKNIREQKNQIEELIINREQNVRNIYEKYGSVNKELNTLSRKILELSKTVSLDDSDAKKDVVAERLITELNSFLILLKSEKKLSLEKRIQQTLNSLMHKENFVSKVLVNIIDDIIDINLLDETNNVINKEALSKGEQQLYATSILKSLVDESGIQFPVFIDSPLQKFDKRHSQKIISEFYPSVSNQVILFPLLFKELTEEEYQFMQPKVKEAYFIKNIGASSCFEHIKPNELFKN